MEGGRAIEEKEYCRPTIIAKNPTTYSMTYRIFPVPGMEAERHCPTSKQKHTLIHKLHTA